MLSQLKAVCLLLETVLEKIFMAAISTVDLDVIRQLNNHFSSKMIDGWMDG